MYPPTVGLYIDGDTRDFGIAKSWHDGLVEHGYRVIQYTPSGWQDGEVDERYEFIVVGTQKGRVANCIRQYGDVGVPSLILEAAYSKRMPPRTPDYRMTCFWNKLNHISEFDAPRDRLSFTLKDRVRGNRPVILATQKFGDAAHNMSEQQVKYWARDTLTQLSVSTKREIVHRPHPDNVWDLEGVRTQNPHEVSVEDALSEADVLVVYNSTLGLHALAAGLQVFCDPSCYYASIADQDLAQIRSPFSVKVDEREAFFARLGYHEYSLSEISTGQALKFMLGARKGRFPRYVPPVKEVVHPTPEVPVFTPPIKTTVPVKATKKA